MSELSKRTAKYYFIQGMKSVGLVLGIEVLLTVEFVVLGMGRDEGFVEYLTGTALTMGSYFMVFMNIIFGMYGPNWYDSMVLSMGARRKDVFWGEIVKQISFITVCTVLHVIIVIASKQYAYLYYVIGTAAIAIVTGPLGLIVGHKIKRYGKIIVVAIVAVCAGFGGFVGYSFASGNTPFTISPIGAFTLAIGGVLLFVLFELWVYKLNSKCMVA